MIGPGWESVIISDSKLTNTKLDSPHKCMHADRAVRCYRRAVSIDFDHPAPSAKSIGLECI